MMNQFDMLADIQEVLVDEESIRRRIREVGAQISEDYRGKNPILVGVLKGVVSLDTPEKNWYTNKNSRARIST